MSTNSFAVIHGHNKMRLPAGRRDGMALVITLAFVVLLTFVVVAFFSRATTDRAVGNSDAGREKADVLARGALNAVIADLQQEMLANSGTSVSNGVTMLSPKTAANMVPERVTKVSGTNYNNLIKQSISAKRLSSAAGGVIIGAAVRTDAASLDGRTVNSTRWDKPMLIGSPTASVPFTSDQIPDWVLVSRAGITSGANYKTNYNSDGTSLNSQYVIGRFAINVYDEGGLLDVNVAGYPTGFASATAIQGTLAGKQLGSIPYVKNPGPFVDWRNGVTKSQYLSYVKSFAAPGGFLSIYRDPVGTTSDNRFLSRQDLINYTLTSGSANITGIALPYLTTFSRELNAPSWKPSAVTSTNPDVTTIRVTGTTPSFTRADGTTAQVGEPLVRTRFPLSRIAGLSYTNNGLNTSGSTTMIKGVLSVASATTVARDFGLVWDPSNNRWVYNNAHTSSAPANSTSILPLDQVKGREPDFFELLKAGVADGSLGKYTYAPSGLDASVSLPWHSALENNMSMDQDKDRQILQIGANIIDQFDADDIPTRITTNVTKSWRGSADSNIAKLDVFGVENNPYIQYVYQTQFRDLNTVVATGTTTLAKYPYCNGYHQFQMWNPHGNAATAGSPSASQYKITAIQGQTFMAPKASTPGPIETLTGRSILFTPARTPDPYLLNQTNATTPDPGPASKYVNGQSKLIGFHFGSVLLPSPTIGGAAAWLYQGYSAPVIYELSGNFGAAGWRVIEQFGEMLDDSMYGSDAGTTAADSFYNAAVQLTTGNNPNWTSSLVWVNSDPRVLRGGFGGAAVGAAGLTNTLTPNSPNGYWQFNFTPSGSSPCWVTTATRNNSPTYYLWELEVNLGSSKTQFKDIDGTLRRGDLNAANPILVTPSTAASLAARPVMLNRPFQSVAEMGYAMRGDPWKTLNFFSADSADSGLLDFFSATEQPAVVAGRVNLNTQQAPVLQALLAASQKTSAGTPLAAPEVAAFSTALTTLTSGTGTLANKGNLVTRTAPGDAAGTFHAAFAPETQNTTDLIKERSETPIRALADVGQTRTWNLMIDMVAQAGRYPSTAIAGALSQFLVEGETRYWLHVAIDRFTGQVIDRQLEVVKE